MCLQAREGFGPQRAVLVSWGGVGTGSVGGNGGGVDIGSDGGGIGADNAGDNGSDAGIGSVGVMVLVLVLPVLICWQDWW